MAEKNDAFRGTPFQRLYYLRSLCVDLQLAIVNVGYRLAPEHPFPTGFNDAYSGLKWVRTHQSSQHLSHARAHSPPNT